MASAAPRGVATVASERDPGRVLEAAALGPNNLDHESSRTGPHRDGRPQHALAARAATSDTQRKKKSAKGGDRGNAQEVRDAPTRERKAMIRARRSIWCEGCFHPIDADDPDVVFAVKHIPDFDHEVVFHRRCFYPGHPLYSELPSRSVSESKSRARQPRPPRGTSPRPSPPPSVHTQEWQPQNHRGSIRLGAIRGKLKSTAFLEITGSDGSARRVPCLVKFGGPWVSVKLHEAVVLERGISYRMVLLREDGVPIEGVTAFEDSDLLRPVSVSSLVLCLTAAKGARSRRSD
jgi:hypothetical protein